VARVRCICGRCWQNRPFFSVERGQKKLHNNVLTKYEECFILPLLTEKPTARPSGTWNLKKEKMKLETIELEIGRGCAIPVKLSDLVDHGKPTALYWEMWGKYGTNNKQWMRAEGLAPRKVNGRWEVVA
jgi:hypothetical protein